VSSSFCLLYKLFTLKLTRKQLIGLCTHTDSPYIRGIGLMYARSVVSTLPVNSLYGTMYWLLYGQIVNNVLFLMLVLHPFK